MTTLTKIKVGAVGALIAGMAVPLAIQNHSLNQLKEENSSLIERTASLAELDNLRDENRRLRQLQVQSEELDRPRAGQAELPRLRGETGQLRRDLAEAKAAAENRATPPATSPDPEPAAPERLTPADLIAASPFRADVAATVQRGETLVTGGWSTAQGKRTFVFMTPEERDGGPGDSIYISQWVIEAEEAVLRSLGFDSILTQTPDSTVSETLSSEVATQLRRAFKEVLPDAYKAQPTVLTSPGEPAALTFQEDQNFTTILVTPSRPTTDGAITLEAQVGRGHPSQPGMTWIGPPRAAP